MTAEQIDQADQTIAGTYARFPIMLEKGQGCTLWDSAGKSYTDFLAGIAVCNLGHAHPRLGEALARQAARLWHVSNLYYTAPQAELAAMLVDLSFADKAFFCNSGAEANEAAIKLARKYFQDQGHQDRFEIIAMAQSFHGRTMATLTATGQDKIKKGFAPLLEGFTHVPFNDIDALAARIGPQTCAVLLEPIQGEGGVNVPGPDYLAAVRRLCDDHGVLLIFDEIQTGMGRTGRLFAYEHYGIEPDIMTLAKALANGLPMGAMLANDKVARTFGPGAHATTFGGTPIVSAAAVEVLKVMADEDVVGRCAATGPYFKERLAWLKGRHDCIIDVRGEGLLLGMKLTVDGAPVVKACMERGFLINCIQERILRFAPPLVIERGEIDRLAACLDEIL